MKVLTSELDDSKVFKIVFICTRRVAKQNGIFWEKKNYPWDWGPKKVTIYFTIFYIKKFRKMFYFLPAFYLIKWLMKSPKTFEKIAILKKMTADFLLRCQNSLRCIFLGIFHRR